MIQDNGASAKADQALLASLPEPASGLGPSGDDPSRDTERMAEFRRATLRAREIAEANERAGPAVKAALWLHQYGPGCVGKGAGRLSWQPAFAASCVGATEAAAYIRDAAIMMLPTIIAEAELLAEADMLRLMELTRRDRDEHPEGEDPKGLSGEAMPARAEGIAHEPPQ